MARGVAHFLSPQPATTAAISTTILSTSMLSPLKLRNGVVSFFLRRKTTRFFCKCSEYSRVSLEYTDAFCRRMDMAGLKPHHRIAMGVSGGADSMALCVLMAQWKKTYAKSVALDSSGFIDGLLAIIVDHGLRPESKEEAQTVSRWVSNMGIRSEIAHCDWPNGLPKLGHLEEAARDMRYQIFQDVCLRHQINVMLIAHHADDQAELFILRLSRNSGVLGLAGMAFTSQLFRESPHFTDESSIYRGILLVRPLLEFTKEDLYKICERNTQKWVEDPTNKSSLFARNRIRTILQDLKNSAFRSELQALIAACRNTRLYVDHLCQDLLNQAVSVIPYGYAVIDLECLVPSEREDICLSKFLALVLQFISQRHRPVRGSASKLLLDYIRTFPCKTSVTAAGCYLCPLPGSKGTKVLVCCSVDSTLPSQTELCSTYPRTGLREHVSHDTEQIVKDQKSKLVHLVPDASDAHFLDAVSSASVLVEASRLKILSESSCSTITELRMKENQLFQSKTQDKCSNKSKNVGQPISRFRHLFQPGQSCYFMSRFFLRWMSIEDRNSCNNNNNSLEEGEETWHQPCSLCMAGERVAYIRPMIEEDWLYLAKMLKEVLGSDKSNQKNSVFRDRIEQVTGNSAPCSDYLQLSAREALIILKSIPAAARRGLPVVVNKDGFILSIPSIGFRHCRSLMISSEFKPRVPLGGGHSSFA